MSSLKTVPVTRQNIEQVLEHLSQMPGFTVGRESKRSKEPGLLDADGQMVASRFILEAFESCQAAKWERLPLWTKMFNRLPKPAARRVLFAALEIASSRGDPFPVGLARRLKALCGVKEPSQRKKEERERYITLMARHPKTKPADAAEAIGVTQSQIVRWQNTDWIQLAIRRMRDQMRNEKALETLARNSAPLYEP